MSKQMILRECRKQQRAHRRRLRNFKCNWKKKKKKKKIISHKQLKLKAETMLLLCITNEFIKNIKIIASLNIIQQILCKLLIQF